MDPEQSRKIEALYEAALGVEPARRAAFLAENCAGDESLRREVESLLLHDENAGQFLEVPAVEALPDRVRLAVGQHVSNYEIQEKLGEGGMGVVYKARDTRLGRSVALKFVKAQFSERFEREARAIAALNHPHIATLYEIGEHAGAPYLAMEFVEGHALKGPRPVKEVIEFGIQIADALAAAHAAGIVHRDLKPANILVTGKGSVKILDFGIAKLTGQAAGGQPATATLTGIGAGTPGYMSPEQIDGKPADSRSDIFAFGCVLYELVSGRHAFEGDSISQVLAATAVAKPKPLDTVPEELEKLIRRCLRKDPEHRLQHIGDARIALEELREDSGKLAPAVQGPASRRTYRKLAWTTLALLAAVALGTGFWLARDHGAAAPRVVRLTAFAGVESYPAFSPDGTQVAFVWNGENQDNSDIYVKMVGSAVALRLSSDPAVDTLPTWSPDGRQIAFVSRRGQSGIYLLSPLGGPERKLVDLAVATGRRPSWSPDGKFLAVARAYDEKSDDPNNGAVLLIPVEARGAPHPIQVPQPARWYWEPTFSPEGRRLAVFSCTGSILANASSCRLEVLALNAELLPQGNPRVIASPVFTPSGMAWTGDGDSLVVGAAGVGRSSVYPGIYLWRVPVRAAGEPERLEAAGADAFSPAIDAKRRRLAFSRSFSHRGVWQCTPEGKPSPFLGPASNPQFSHDGRHIAFLSPRSGDARDIWVTNADGTGWAQITRELSWFCGTPRWSPDDRWIAFDTWSKNGRWNIWVVDASGGPARALTHGRDDSAVPSWSGDGKWVYFYSNPSGRTEIWRAPAQGGQAEQITRRGGQVAFESVDGKTLYYTKSFNGVEGLFAMPLAGGEERQVFTDRVLVRGFVVFSDGIYYITGQGRDLEIRFHGFVTGRSRRVADIEGPLIEGLSVSPDRKTFLFTRAIREADLMMIENFR